MSDVLKLESTLTDRYQTTVPDAIRRALKLSKRDKLCYFLQADGSVVLQKAEPQTDPVLDSFLQFLAADMQAHPEKLQPVSRSLQRQIKSLVKGVEVDLDEPLSPHDE